MADLDWNKNKKQVADTKKILEQYPNIQEFAVSPDGEKIAAVVKNQEGQFTACVNGELWSNTYEYMWHLRFLPNGKLIALVKIDGEWTLAVDNEAWPEKFEYAWNPKLSENGETIGLLCKRDNVYGVSLNGKFWENTFLSIRDYAISPDGKHAAATVQIDPLKEADVEGFFKGVWSVAVDGSAWGGKYVNCWSPIFNSDSSKVAAEIRTGICEYSIALDNKPWDTKFGCVWAPIFKPGSSSVITPIRDQGKWSLAENGSPIWGGYVQIWQHKFSPDASKIAAIVAPSFGKWTIAVNDKPWADTYSDMVLSPIFSPDSKNVAAIIKDNDKWTIAVNGKAWKQDFDMIWDPALSTSGSVAAKAEKDKKYMIVLNGNIIPKTYEKLWDPIFSPDGEKILLRYVEDGKYFREVAAFGDLK
ncbi:electron transfer complex subunit TmcD [Elusimicrobiota bacterium]